MAACIEGEGGRRIREKSAYKVPPRYGEVALYSNCKFSTAGIETGGDLQRARSRPSSLKARRKLRIRNISRNSGCPAELLVEAIRVSSARILRGPFDHGNRPERLSKIQSSNEALRLNETKTPSNDQPGTEGPDCGRDPARTHYPLSSSAHASRSNGGLEVIGAGARP